MSTDNNRLLLEIDRTIRDISRDTINPEIPELSVTDLEPVIRLTARARALYLKELFDLADVVGEGMPSQQQIDKLAELRLHYEELVAGAQAMEIAIQRGYLDVQGQSDLETETTASEEECE